MLAGASQGLRKRMLPPLLLDLWFIIVYVIINGKKFIAIMNRVGGILQSILLGFIFFILLLLVINKHLSNC